jgi:hypothetical protein
MRPSELIPLRGRSVDPFQHTAHIFPLPGRPGPGAKANLVQVVGNPAHGAAGLTQGAHGLDGALLGVLEHQRATIHRKLMTEWHQPRHPLASAALGCQGSPGASGDEGSLIFREAVNVYQPSISVGPRWDRKESGEGSSSPRTANAIGGLSNEIDRSPFGTDHLARLLITVSWVRSPGGPLTNQLGRQADPDALGSAACAPNLCVSGADLKGSLSAARRVDHDAVLS